ALFNASQMYMQQGRALAEQRDYIGAYNAFRQAYGYDPVNQLALSEMERTLRLQEEKTGVPAAKGGNVGAAAAPNSAQADDGTGGTPAAPRTTNGAQDPATLPPPRTEQLRVIKYSGDLKALVRNLTEQLNLNVIFDSQSFRTPRTVEVNLTDVTTAQALDLLFIQESLFFQKLSRRTILVADQNRRAQYQQLSIRTFYLSNIDPNDARNLISAAIPPNQGRPQTVVLPDKATNSVTIRDTAENLRLIGEILQSIDKDRAEVVMDVNIYEVSRTDLLQLGNQVGVGDSSSGGLFTLGGTSGLSIVGGARDVAGRLTNVPTALGAALVIPSSVLTAFQSKNRTRLLASTQVHAFNGEESSARIGQRVPVQTAQTFPFGTTNPTTPGGVQGGVNFGGGFPVIQYEPTGLTLKFTPQVFPNLDVQVKMSIESKDILNAGSLTPTFTERTISGTARIQNNRTMMLASVAQDTQSNGRRGLPLLGLIPVLGRLFTSPTRNNTQVDIVIAVTPRVLRAPAVTPSDERERPSGTLSTPTSSSLEAMVREVEREDQLAAARRIPTNTVVQLPDAEMPGYVPAPASMLKATSGAGAPALTASPAMTGPINTAATALPAGPNMLGNALAQLTGEAPPSPAALVGTAAQARPINVSQALTAAPQPAAFTPAATTAKATTTAAAQGGSSTGGAALPVASSGEKVKEAAAGNAAAAKPGTTVELRLMPAGQEMRPGEKQRLSLVLISAEALGNTMLRLTFDPKLIAVRGISQGEAATGGKTAPAIMQSIDPAGTVMIAVSPQAGAALKSGANVLLFLDIEALAAGESAIGFDQNSAHIVATDGHSMPLKFVESRITVRQ
ncbi:MAG TPA: secretin N-terminal domain-containing protein, partial [Pyrinomonadaceae bacterium]